MDSVPSVIEYNLGIIADILQAVGIIIGLALFLGGILQLKKYGEMRTMMSAQMSIWGPLSMMLSGVMLLILPTMISTALFAFWGTSNPLQYQGTGSGYDEYVPAIILFVRLVGVGAFIRGVVLISRSGAQGGGHPGTLSKAIMHIFGGILCIHVLGTVQLLKSILDIGT